MSRFDLLTGEGARNSGIPTGVASTDRNIVWLSGGRGEVVRRAEDGWAQVTGGSGPLGKVVTVYNCSVTKEN